MTISFTGSRLGMTANQREALLYLLQKYKPTVFHHGDCIGADSDAHTIAHSLGITIVIHPPLDSRYRAFRMSKYIRPPFHYIGRNHDIVMESDVLIAAPKETTEQLRSGTWATIRYARKQNKPVIIIHPSGEQVIQQPKHGTKPALSCGSPPSLSPN